MAKFFSMTSRIAATALLASFGQTALAHAQETTTAPSASELQARLDALQQELQDTEQELQATQHQQAVAANAAAAAPAPTTGWWSNTSVSGRMYWDVTNIDHESNGSQTGLHDNGTSFDIKRFYIGVDHTFNDVFSANITTDFQWNSSVGATELFIKKAYLQAKVSPALTLRFGSADLPWIPFVEDIYGYRYVENTLIDRTKFGTSADWGVHALGALNHGMFHYAVAVVNGAGYKNPPGTGNAPRFQSVDIEGRANINIGNFVLGVGGYSGRLGKDVQDTVTHHTANRLDLIAAYTTPQLRLGVEYFKANDWNNVTSLISDEADGYSAFGSYQFAPQWGVFGRYDHVEPNQSTNSALDDKYYTVGLSWSPAHIVDFSLAYKHDEASHGTISTSNGAIGGSNDGSYDEVGIWSQFRW